MGDKTKVDCRTVVICLQIFDHFHFYMIESGFTFLSFWNEFGLNHLCGWDEELCYNCSENYSFLVLFEWSALNNLWVKTLWYILKTVGGKLGLSSQIWPTVELWLAQEEMQNHDYSWSAHGPLMLKIPDCSASIFACPSAHIAIWKILLWFYWFTVVILFVTLILARRKMLLIKYKSEGCK